MVNTFTIDPGLPGKERQQLAAFLEETATRAASGNNPKALPIAFIRVLADRVTAAGPVTIKVGQMAQEERFTARRILHVAARRAKEETSLPVAGAVDALLAAWEQLIGYDPKVRYEGPRNLWGEPVTAKSGKAGLADLWTPVGG